MTTTSASASAQYPLETATSEAHVTAYNDMQQQQQHVVLPQDSERIQQRGKHIFSVPNSSGGHGYQIPSHMVSSVEKGGRNIDSKISKTSERVIAKKRPEDNNNHRINSNNGEEHSVRHKSIQSQQNINLEDVATALISGDNNLQNESRDAEASLTQRGEETI